MEPRPHDVNKRVVEAVKTILEELNGGNRQKIARDIFETIRYEHRTLQQHFWSVIVMAQCSYACSQSDLRNADSVKLAQAVKELAEKNNWDGGLSYV